MSETQDYKKEISLTFAAGCSGYVRDLFARRLDNLNEVLKDDEARRVFSRDDMVAMAFEAIQLAKMLASITKAEAVNA